MACKKQKTSRKKSHHIQKRPTFEISDANSEPIKLRVDKSWSVDEELRGDECGVSLNQGKGFLADHVTIKDFQSKDLLSLPPPPPKTLLSNWNIRHRTSGLVIDLDQDAQGHQDVATVTDGSGTKSPTLVMMNANGTHPQHRHQQPHLPRDKKNQSSDASPSINTTSIGPMPSHIQVAKPYVFHQAIEGCLHDLGVAQAREDNIRLAGVQWIDNVRKALKLPVRTFDTAVIYYHKFRLTHADNEYSFVDAAAAALFAACKIEDTLKKSRDILCAAHNTKVSSRADHLSSDDPIFEHQSRTIIGLERLMLEASSFDFRNRHPQQLIVKLAKYYGYERHSAVTKTAHLISLDLYRTFAPLKQGTATMAFACLELAGRLHGQEKEAIVDGKDYQRWDIERAMVMETLLDLLELYTHYRTSTTVGPEFSLDAFLEVRLPLNEELASRRIPRYTEYIDTSQFNKRADPAGYAVAAAPTNGVLRPSGPNGMAAANGRPKTSPTSPATPSTPGIRQKAGERGREGTVRFMLNPDREREEKTITALYAPLMASMKK